MIRIRLINEGKVVKQITSRVHESVVLEQINKYKDPFDTVQIVEGELSEGAKDMLQHVARKIVPAAMAAGVALGGANASAQGGANPNYPGLNKSVGQHISDIVSPNYKEIMRQRQHQRSTERQVWDAEQNEIRRQRVADARSRAGGGQQHVIYDQSRLSQDGKSYIIYGIDNKVRRIPVAGTEYMAGDSQRLPHYITSGGNVLYVRHPHAVTESVTEGSELKQAKRKYNQAAKDANADQAGAGKKIDTMKKSLRQKDVDNKKEVTEGYTVTRGIDKERYQERAGLEGPFSTKSGKVVYYDPQEGKYYDPDTDMYIGHDDWVALNEGWKEKLAAAALAGTMALGAAGAQARVSPDDDPGINRLSGKPVATQVAPAASQAVQPGASLPSKNLQAVDSIDGNKASGYTITQDGKSFDVKVVPKGSPTPRGAKMMKVTQSQLGERGIGNYVVYLLNNGTAYLYMGDVSEGYDEMDEDAPGLVKAAAGLALGGVAAAGAPAIIGILGPLLGIPMAAYGAYSAAKLGMKGVEKLWDMASEKLGGDDKVAQYANAKLATLPPEQAKAGAEVVKKIGESKQGTVAEDATVGTIPASGTVGTSGRTQFAPTGKTTNAKFNKNGQIELDTEQEDDGSVNLDADAVKQLQQAGVQIKEEIDSPVAGAITRRILLQRSDLLSKYGPVLVMQAIDEVADYVGDVEEIGSSDVSGWVKQVEQMLDSNPPEAFGEAVNEGTDTLEGILSKYSADYAKFKAGGDIDENQDFFDALYDHYLDSGEMPYTIAKGRDGDPYEWITQRLDQEAGIDPVAEAEGDEAGADQNIIMQIRKASDYEKPTRVELADGTESVIAPNIAKQILAKFDKMKPESKELLQNTLNTEAGFKEILAYFGGGVREQAVARVNNIMQAAVAEAGWGRRDRRDAYQRDYDSSVAGMGKRQSLAYQLDGGANDEGWDKPEQERSYYKKAPAKKGYYFYNVPADQTAKAEELGLFKTKSGKWYSPFENTRANMFFGAGRYWEPK